MRRLALFLLVICLALSSVTIAGAAYQDGFTIDDSKKEIISYQDQNKADLGIPEYVGGIKVERIGPGVFKNNETLKTVTVPSGVTFIDAGAFEGCTTLQSIALPSNLSQLGERVFAGCTKLTTVNGFFNTKIQILPAATFEKCSSLDKVELPKDLTSIGNGAFSYSGLSSVSLPINVTVLGANVFQECASLTTANLNSNLKTIGDFAFTYCSEMGNLTIPSSVDIIGEGAFSGCAKLSSINLPDVKLVRAYTFQNCTNLKSITIPDSVSTIGRGAFMGSGLTDVVVPSTVTSIWPKAFYNNTLIKVTFLGIAPVMPRNVLLGITPEPVFNGSTINFLVYYPGSLYGWPTGNTWSPGDGGTYPIEAMPRVTFDSQGGSPVAGVNVIKGFALSSSSLKEMPKPEKIGYRFDGWVIGTAPDSKVWEWATEKVVSPVTLYAKWTPEQYAVTFDDTAIPAQSVPFKGKVEKPKVDPSKLGHVFNGWYKDEARTTPWVFESQEVTGTTTIYAKWEPLSYTVGFAGAGIIEPKLVKYGEVVPEIPNPTRTGYKFAGWFTDSTYSFKWESTSKVTNGIVLYAKWSSIKVTSVKRYNTPLSLTLSRGKSKRLRVTVAPTTALNRSIAWSSSSKRICSVSSNGTVKALRKGSVTITAKAKDGSGKYVKFTIRVK